MSNKQTDLYLEELEILKEDVKDAFDAYEKARQETINAFNWEMKMKHNFRDLENRLEILKQKDA